MISKDSRLTKKEFDHYFPLTHAIHGTHFFIRYYINKGEHNKFAVVIPKKIIKLAVKRHLLKRKVFHTIQSLLKDQTIPPNQGIYIVIMKKNDNNLVFNNISQEIHELFKKIQKTY